jgi:hypothetical protein
MSRQEERDPFAARPLARARGRSYVTGQLTRERPWEETLRSNAVALIGMAVATSMVGLSLTEPAVGKVRKGCRDQQQQSNQTGECNDIIIENLDRGPSSKGPFYHHSNSQRAKRHPLRTR